MAENMLFNYETTYRSDFRNGAISNIIKTVFVPKPERPRPPPPPLKDIQAMFPLRDPNLPFTAFHRPTPIIRTNPWVMPEKIGKLEDSDRRKVQLTRPNVCSTPGFIPLDQVEEPTRQTIVDFIYKSTVMKALDETAELTRQENKLRAPLPNKYAPAKPVALQPLRLPYVSGEWRMPSVSWDKKQIRTHTEPTKRFWLSRELKSCRPCKETAIAHANRKLVCRKKTQK